MKTLRIVAVAAALAIALSDQVLAQSYPAPEVQIVQVHKNEPGGPSPTLIVVTGVYLNNTYINEVRLLTRFGVVSGTYVGGLYPVDFPAYSVPYWFDDIEDGSYILQFSLNYPVGPAQGYPVGSLITKTTFFSVTVGAVGPQGPQGDRGRRGPTGDTGPEGPRGRRGEIGPTGPRGATGPEGPRGPRGLQGIAGPIGPTGVTGPIGLNWRGAWNASFTYQLGDAVSHLGSAWIARGSQPPIGAPGADVIWSLLAQQGVIGPTGPTGSAGAIGPVGPMGLAGPAGAPGATGAKGLNWRGEFIPSQGYSADDVVSYGGSSWVAVGSTLIVNVPPGTDPRWQLVAEKGDPGDVTTAAGATGAVGPTGATGEQGIPGEVGPAGSTGPQGDPGVAGAAGTPGADGEPGMPGMQGLQGPPGPTGASGERGDRGLLWRGAFDSEAATAYAAGDAVSYNGSSWVANIATTAIPGEDPAWDLLAQQGEPGSSGSGALDDVTASDPLSSSGGASPNISLTGVVPIDHGGTGRTTVGASGTYLRSNGSALSYSTILGSEISGNVSGFSGALTGDVTGTQGATTVARIQGVRVSTINPTTGQALVCCNAGGEWMPAQIFLGGDVSGNSGQVEVQRIRGVLVSDATPSAGQLLVSDGSGWIPGGALNNASTAIGNGTMANNGASASAAFGASALRNNSAAGHWNTAVGHTAMLANTTGTTNTAVGQAALDSNLSGSDNTAVGRGALGDTTTGSSNIALGAQAGVGVTGSNTITIGNAGVAGESGTIRIGKAVHTSSYLAGVFGSTAPSGIGVVVGSDGKLGTVVSARRFKDDIRPMSDPTDRFMRLRPVTFRYKDAATDGSRPVQYGLIADEVAEVYPELVAVGPDGRPLTVYYQFLAPLLLNRVQEQQRTIEALTARLSALEERVSRKP